MYKHVTCPGREDYLRYKVMNEAKHTKNLVVAIVRSDNAQSRCANGDLLINAIADLERQLSEAQALAGKRLDDLIECRTYYDEETINRVILQKQNAELRELLKASKCPNSGCDNNGTIAQQVAYDEWEPEQCQWCDEKRKAIANSGAEGL